LLAVWLALAIAPPLILGMPCNHAGCEGAGLLNYPVLHLIWAIVALPVGLVLGLAVAIPILMILAVVWPVIEAIGSLLLGIVCIIVGLLFIGLLFTAPWWAALIIILLLLLLIGRD
jgi:hypothetical protein